MIGSICYELISYGDFQVNQIKELDLIFSVRYYTIFNRNIHMPKAKYEMAIGQP